MSKALFSVLLGILGTSSLLADTTLPIVVRYSDAQNEELWKKVDRNEVPDALVGMIRIPTPKKAFQPPYTKAFLQNERLVVCLMSCDQSQKLKAKRDSSGNYTVVASGTDHTEIFRQTNVYYWINHLFDQMEKLGWKPKRQLRVLVDRDVQDPKSGVDFQNNAFFNDADWTLSFLPAGSSILLKTMGVNLGPSGNDPSVAMHEAIHSIFADIIGPILNPEIYGLHEAFADYFSMAVLENPHLGTLMMRGKTLRSAAKLGKYTVGMEAHDLGNVVSAALWNIRGLFASSLLADQVALETIRQVSLNPYASAGDVSTAHLQALKLLAQSEVTTKPSIEAEISGIWRESGLAPSTVEPVLADLVGPNPSPRRMSALISEVLPQSVARDFGLPTRSELAVTQSETRAASQEELTWYQVSLGKDSVQPISFWILYHRKLKALVAAYTLDLRPVTRESSEFASLVTLTENLTSVIELDRDFGKDALEMFQLKSPGIKAVRDRTSSGPVVELNGRSVTLAAHTRDIKVTFLGSILGLLGGVEFKALLREVREVTIYTVSPQVVSNPLLPSWEGQTVVGYGLVTGSGVQDTLILTEVR